MDVHTSGNQKTIYDEFGEGTNPDKNHIVVGDGQQRTTVILMACLGGSINKQQFYLCINDDNPKEKLGQFKSIKNNKVLVKQENKIYMLFSKLYEEKFNPVYIQNELEKEGLIVGSNNLMLLNAKFNESPFSGIKENFNIGFSEGKNNEYLYQHFADFNKASAMENNQKIMSLLNKLDPDMRKKYRLLAEKNGNSNKNNDHLMLILHYAFNEGMVLGHSKILEGMEKEDGFSKSQKLVNTFKDFENQFNKVMNKIRNFSNMPNIVWKNPKMLPVLLCFEKNAVRMVGSYESEKEIGAFIHLCIMYSDFNQNDNILSSFLEIVIKNNNKQVFPMKELFENFRKRNGDRDFDWKSLQSACKFRNKNVDVIIEKYILGFISPETNMGENEVDHINGTKRLDIEYTNDFRENYLNDLSNKTLLPKSDNIQKSNQPPMAYFNNRRNLLEKRQLSNLEKYKNDPIEFCKDRRNQMEEILEKRFSEIGIKYVKGVI